MKELGHVIWPVNTADAILGGDVHVKVLKFIVLRLEV